jgi:DNA mismatch repair protein MutS2
MIDNYMLYKNLPTVDLHGLDRTFAVIKVNEFILDNYKLNNKLVILIHGKGNGVLKKEIHKCLKTNKLVIDYKLDLFNEGATIVEIK